MDYEGIKKQIEIHMNNVAIDRDKLDEFISEIQDLRGDCDEAYDALVNARDALSHLV